MSKLLIDEPPLQVLPSLATAIGLNEAIVIQQIHYWLGIQQKSQNDFCYREGRWWCYNTYEDWQKQFPWWSISTIRRIFTNLRDKFGVIIAKELGPNPHDHTLWYTIDYDKLSEISEQIDVFKMNRSPVQNEQIDVSNLNTSSYTETTTESTSRESANAPPPADLNGQQSLTGIDPPLQKSKNEKSKRDPRTDHPAVQAIRQVRGRYPPRAVYDDVIAVLGDEPDLQRLERCYKHWVLCGYNANSLIWATEWYASGIPERARSNGNKSNGRRRLTGAELQEIFRRDAEKYNTYKT